MKPIRLILGLVALLAVLSGFVNSNEWMLFETNDFKAEFPSKPNSETQTLNSAIGALKMDIYMYDASSDSKDDNLTYGVITTEYPDSIVNSDMVENIPTFFRGSIDGAVKNVNGKLLSESEIKLDGFPGREVDIDFKNGLAVIKMQIYLVKNKLFILQTITKTEKYPNNSIDKFMKSFKLKS